MKEQTTEIKHTWGGKRIGAGRKAELKLQKILAFFMQNAPKKKK